MNWTATRRWHLRYLPAFVFLFGPCAGAARAGIVPQLVTIEPDNYATGQILDHVSPHVTLSTGAFSDYRPTFSVSAAEDSDGASTGTKVFAQGAGVSFWNINRALRMDFHAFVTNVRVDYMGSGFFGESYTARLEAYSPAGVLLSSDVTAPLAGGQVEALSVSAPRIGYALAFPVDDPFGDLDNLSFTVPEPATPLLGAFAIGAVAFIRRRRRAAC
jgi:MYXO-CTERM domain-containing protein